MTSRWTEEQARAIQARNAPVVQQFAAPREVPVLSPGLRQEPVVAANPPKRSKYGGRKVLYDHIIFDSGAECERYQELRLREQARMLRGLIVHPVFPLIVEGQHIGVYRADFAYRELVGEGLIPGPEIVEDVKSPATAAKETFRRTLKIIKALYGIDIVVVMKGAR